MITLLTVHSSRQSSHLGTMIFLDVQGESERKFPHFYLFSLLKMSCSEILISSVINTKLWVFRVFKGEHTAPESRMLFEESVTGNLGLHFRDWAEAGLTGGRKFWERVCLQEVVLSRHSADMLISFVSVPPQGCWKGIPDRALDSVKGYTPQPLTSPAILGRSLNCHKCP